MPVTEQTPVISHSGNGVTTVFAYNFKILAAADIEVSVDGVVKTLTTDYSVSGVGAGGGGNVTMVSPPASGTGNVVLRRNMAYARSADYQENGDLTAEQADEDADRPIMMIQQIAADQRRSIKLPVGETAEQELTESAAERANKYLGFDSSGDIIAVSVLSDGDLIVSTFIESLLDDATAAEARATLGIGSEDITLAVGKKIIFEGTTDDAYETTIDPGEPTADNTLTLPNKSGTMATTGDIPLNSKVNKSSAYTVVAADKGKVINATTGTWTLSLTAAATLGDGFVFGLKMDGATAITIDPDGSETIDGATTKVVTSGLVLVYCDGTKFTSFGSAGGGLVLGTAIATTSGTAIDITSIPAGVKIFVLPYAGVSTNGTSNIIAQIGDSGGVETSGYVGSYGGSASGTLDSSGFTLQPSVGAGDAISGAIFFILQNTSTNTWTAIAVSGRSSNGLYIMGGHKALTGTLDRVRLTTVGGTATFDAGSINILYWE